MEAHEESPMGTPPGSIHFEHDDEDDIDIGSLVGALSDLEFVEHRYPADPFESLSGDSEISDPVILSIGSASQPESVDSSICGSDFETEVVSRIRTAVIDSDSDETSEVDTSAQRPGEDEWPCIGDSG